MDCKLINLDSSIDLELLNKLENNYLSNRLYLEYQNEYHKFKGKNKCFQVSFKNETYNFCFNSSGEKDNSRVSYYNNPVGIDIINNNYDNYINAHNNFIKEIKSNILREIFLEKIILPEELNKYLKDFQFNNNLIEIFEKTIIDLNVNEKLIFKNFSKGHKSNIKKKDDLEYQIINHINYK